MHRAPKVAASLTTADVPGRAWLKGTEFPKGPQISGPHIADVRGVVRDDRPATRLQRLRYVVGGTSGLFDIDRCGSQPLLPFAACRRDRQRVIARADAAHGAGHLFREQQDRLWPRPAQDGRPRTWHVLAP